MSSPIPPDPYEALGVAKDADVSAVRTAHRKLVLKHHPDRIQDPALKEKGQHLFTTIQQAYELLSDPARRSRYDQRIKLAELQKDAMMRDSPRTHAYPMRPAAHSASSSREFSSREFSSGDGAYYETRRPRDSRDSRDTRDTRESREPNYFDSKEKFEQPTRTTSRKYSDYERASTAKKPSTGDRSAKAAWGVAAEAVKFGIRVKKDSEKAKANKAHQAKQETRDREKRQARADKDRRAHVVDMADSDSDSDTATHVTTATNATASTIRPSKSNPGLDPSSARSSGAYSQRRAYTDDDSDTGTYVSSKWERSHGTAKEYMEKAAAASGTRPSIARGDSFWGMKKSGSDSEKRPSEKRPTSSRGKRGGSYDELPSRPAMPTQNSSPANLKARMEERAPKERRSATGSYPDHRKEMPSMPSFSRSQTMPTQRPASRRDAAPSKSSNLKHAETHDSGYGSSSTPQTPEMREESPPRRPKMATRSSTKYQIVDPSGSDDDTRSTIRVLNNESDRRRYQRSPERDLKESDRRREKDRSARPRLDTRSKTTRDVPVESSKSRRATESSKYREEQRSPRDPGRDETPPMSRNNSGRERERKYAELSDDGEKPYRYKYPSGEKINTRSAYAEPQYTKYQTDRRHQDYSPGSRFPEGFSTSRRPSVQAHG